MRFFQTSNASRRYRAGGFAFTFEPVDNIGGSWSGVLAVEDNSAASALAAESIPQIKEITAEEFEGLKKKPQRNHSFLERPSQLPPQSSPSLPVVGPAAPLASTASEAAPLAAATKLKTAKVDVPDELKLETGDKRKK